MRRREPPKPPAGTVVEPPLWTQKILDGLRYAKELVDGSQPAGKGDVLHLGHLMPVLRAERARWCAENGCYWRPRPCVEVYGKPCDKYGAGRRPGGNNDE